MVSYLLGSIPFGKLIARHFFNVDIQKRGSGNIGFANVRRTLGWPAGLATLAGDILKGLIPTLWALSFATVPEASFVGLAAIIGHIFPIWLKLRGGKGIATGLGVVIALSPWVAALSALVYIFTSILLRRSSHASLLGVFTMLVSCTLLAPTLVWFYTGLSALAVATLWPNLTGSVPQHDK